MRYICALFVYAAFVSSTVKLTSGSQQDVPHNQRRENVIVNGETYYVADGYLTRDESMEFCASNNMTLLTFDRPGRFEDIYDWTWQSGLSSQIFWTSALRPEDSKKWIWELTGEPIMEFPWGLNEPNLENTHTRQCIYFWPYFGGYFDEDCSNFNSTQSTYIICQV